jgi:hypothetical protein
MCIFKEPLFLETSARITPKTGIVARIGWSGIHLAGHRLQISCFHRHFAYEDVFKSFRTGAWSENCK